MSRSDDSDDRRRAERVQINEEFANLTPMFVSDLSEQGVFIHTDKQVPIGTNLELRFTVLLDDPVLIEGVGKVVRHQAEPPGMGIEFASLRPEMVLRINDVISRQRPRDVGLPVLPSAVSTGPQPTVEGPEPSASTTGPSLPRGPTTDDFDNAITMFRLKAIDVEILDEEDEDEVASTLEAPVVRPAAKRRTGTIVGPPSPPGSDEGEPDPDADPGAAGQGTDDSVDEGPKGGA